MGTIYVDTGGNAANSGSTDSATATISGTAATKLGTRSIQLDAGTVLTGIVTTPGPTQSSINIAGATNTTCTIFFISAVTGSGGATPTITIDPLSPDPTLAAASAWRIGGWYVWPGGATANVVEGALRAGDILQFNNSPATRTFGMLTFKASGDSTNGRVSVIGKAGQLPVLTMNGNQPTFNGNSLFGWFVSNLSFTSNATTSAICVNMSGVIFDHCKIVGTGVGAAAHGLVCGGSCLFQYCEISGCGGDGINGASGSITLQYNYIHDVTGNGVTFTTPNPTDTVIGNVFANCAKAISLSGASTSLGHVVTIAGNTIYQNNANAAVEVTDPETIVLLTDNIIQNIGTGYAVSWLGAPAERVGNHGYNVFASAGTALNGLTANSTEVVGNPLLLSPGTGNFGISPTSPAAGAGQLGQLPLAGLSIGYRDIGAIQRQVPLSSGGAAGVIGS